jgi:hypothetical protein
MDEGDYDLESPVWWDPKVRRVVLDASSFEPSLVLVRDGGLVLAAARGVICAGALSDATYAWPEVAGLPVCDLGLGGRTFRMYFCHPHPRARVLEPATVEEITAAVVAAGHPGGVWTRRVSVMRMPSHTGLNPGGKRMQRFRALVE